MTSSWFRWPPVVILLLSGTAANLFAEQPPKSPLAARVELQYRRCRSGAPIPVLWKIESENQTIIEGILEFEVYDQSELLGRFRIPDLVLSPGKNEFASALPAFSVHSISSPLRLTPRFITGPRPVELEEQALRVSTRSIPWFSVGVVSGATNKPSDDETRLFDAVRLENHLGETDGSRQSATVSYDLRSDGLAADPLALCNFDVVALTPAGLAELRDDQVDALRKWVAAGGSLCVVAGGGLSARHALFLNDLFSEKTDSRHAKPGGDVSPVAAAKQEFSFVVDGHGYLSPGEKAAGEIASARKGLGRVVILRQPLLKTLAPEGRAWQTAAAFLLKVRLDRQPAGHEWNLGAAIKSILPKPPGRPTPPPAGTRPQRRAPPSNRQPSYPAGYALQSPLSTFRLTDVESLFQLLMPTNVRIVPLGLVGLILIAYVVTIGPIDYFLLGLLRLRRFTWIFFLLTTVGFAAFTLWLSQWYLGTNDSRRGLVINDVVEGGAVARSSRIELLFLSRERDVDSEVQNGLFSQIGLGTSVVPGPGGNPVLMSAISGMPHHFVGRYPTRYVVGQSVPQWTPVANRLFWISPPPAKFPQTPEATDGATFDWNDPGEVETAAGRSALAQRVRRAFGTKACAMVYRGDREITVMNELEQIWPWNGLARQRLGAVNAIAESSPADVVRELSVRAPVGFFGVASQVSPNGGPELEDLALLDPSDRRQSLLAIAVATENNLVVFRRLYAGEH